MRLGAVLNPGKARPSGKAVLERFRQIGCLAIATTHYNRLKVYAETTKDVSNAAMEFNEQTLEPTYRLIHGLAGASSGLKIAERLQMPISVLREATTFLDTGEADVALYVDELRRRIMDLESGEVRARNATQRLRSPEGEGTYHLTDPAKRRDCASRTSSSANRQRDVRSCGSGTRVGARGVAQEKVPTQTGRCHRSCRVSDPPGEGKSCRTASTSGDGQANREGSGRSWSDGSRGIPGCYGIGSQRPGRRSRSPGREHSPAAPID